MVLHLHPWFLVVLGTITYKKWKERHRDGDPGRLEKKGRRETLRRSKRSKSGRKREKQGVKVLPVRSNVGVGDSDTVSWPDNGGRLTLSERHTVKVQGVSLSPSPSVENRLVNNGSPTQYVRRESSRILSLVGLCPVYQRRPSDRTLNLHQH